MRIVRHPLVDQDLAALVDHIVDVTGGDFDAAGRRLDEVDDLIADKAERIARVLESPGERRRRQALPERVRRLLDGW